MELDELKKRMFIKEYMGDQMRKVVNYRNSYWSDFQLP